jgi:NADPH-dependent 2,4-dienoyl-CoA reductase/sulfur reductase-like enzyme
LKQVDLAVIGGGPAGMAAAVEAARAGMEVGLIHEASHPGGKVLRPGIPGIGIGGESASVSRTRRLIFGQLKSFAARIRVYDNAEVWHVSSDRAIEFSAGGELKRSPQTLCCKRLIVAPGAVERVIPFPGWTLPGVFTVGGLNTLVKRGVVPGKRCLVAGSGILLPLLAHHLARAGVRVVGVVAPMAVGNDFQHIPALISGLDTSRWIEGLQFLWAFIKHRIPVYTSSSIAGVTGDESVRSVVITDVDSHWRPVKGTEKTIAADTVAMGYGLMPSVELTRQLGCEHHYDRDRGYWRTVSNVKGGTSLPWVLMAGDGVEIKGYPAAVHQGRIAGIEAAAQLGFHIASREAAGMTALLRKIERQRRFGRTLDALTLPRPGILDLLTDDTVICRCEEITYSTIKTAVANGARDINDIKRRTRLGMGHCQGRFCGQVINELLWKLIGRKTKREIFTPRIPVRAVSFGELSGEFKFEARNPKSETNSKS